MKQPMGAYVSGFSRVQRYRDGEGRRWASIALRSGEPCFISVASHSIIVKRSRFGLFGALIYRETNAAKVVATARALAAIFPANLLPGGLSSPILSEFANTALHSADSSHLRRLLNNAVHIAAQQDSGGG